MEFKLLDVSEIYVGDKIVEVRYITCGVALFFWNAKKKLGGSLYFISLDEKPTTVPTNIPNWLEYTVRNIMKLLDPDRVHRQFIRAKIVGGADITGLNLGKKNINEVFKILKNAKIPVGGYDYGRSVVRTCFFHPQDGRVVVEYSIGGTKTI